jgi:NAD(P)-dependent dehydrogenase (short-subunit alcohol dehydrogenase family)
MAGREPKAARDVTALVTGSAGGIGRAIVTKLRAEGFEVKELDLVSGFDVSDPTAWAHRLGRPRVPERGRPHGR